MTTNNNIYNVKLSSRAHKGLKKVPLYVALKLNAQVMQVGTQGLTEVRKIPGYHDEPLNI